MSHSSFLTGFALSGALIVAIGAQNAFLLRQGIKREHVWPVVVLCALSDALLIAAGVAGLGALVQQSPGLLRAITVLGTLFLVAYGLCSLWAARHPGSLQVAAISGGASTTPLLPVLLQAAAFTYLNPHVYLDTVLLVGSVGAQQSPAHQPWFVLGGTAASVVWFVSLGYGARWLAPLFAKPAAWRVLDVLIGLTMLVLAGMVWRHAG